jgi:predicted tellurium resistance membrane protein TerC
MVDEITIMVTAVILAVGVMMLSARPISLFVNRHPTLKGLALSFLLLIGVSLVGDGLSMHIPKGYIYFAVCFSVLVQAINLRVRRAAASDGRDAAARQQHTADGRMGAAISAPDLMQRLPSLPPAPDIRFLRGRKS